MKKACAKEGGSFMDISSTSAIVHSNQEGIEKAKTNNMTVQDKPTDEVQSESVIDTQHMAVSADGDTVDISVEAAALSAQPASKESAAASAESASIKAASSSVSSSDASTSDSTENVDTNNLSGYTDTELRDLYLNNKITKSEYDEELASRSGAQNATANGVSAATTETAAASIDYQA